MASCFGRSNARREAQREEQRREEERLRSLNLLIMFEMRELKEEVRVLRARISVLEGKRPVSAPPVLRFNVSSLYICYFV